jgi:hypothetical protein
VAVRLLLLLVLLVGAATVVASLRPARRGQADLSADLAAGRVTYIEYRAGDHRVRWVDGWAQWREAHLEVWPQSADDALGGQPPPDLAQNWLSREVDAAHHPRPELHVEGAETATDRWWLSRIPWPPLRVVTTVAWLLTLAIMVNRSRHRYANRWAWLWLFTLGQVGALLYLIFEPHPIWRPAWWPPRRPGRRVAGGWTGLFWAILLGIPISVAAAIIASI